MSTLQISGHIIILIFLCFCPLPSLSTVDTFVFGSCSQLRYTPNSAFECNLNSLLTSLVNPATQSSYNSYTIQGSSPQDTLYGLYQCRSDLSMPDCATCISLAVTKLSTFCSFTCGGSLQLEGCFVRYENSTFLGQEDKTLVLDICGPLVQYDVEAMAGQNAVLATLMESRGAYRVGETGKVQGLAQCIGDLSSSQCQDCIEEAIGQLKTVCGIAEFGDMFLGKCYARYNTHGPPEFSYEADHDRSSNDKYSSHDREKTFRFVRTSEIIIGLLSGGGLLTSLIVLVRKQRGPSTNEISISPDTEVKIVIPNKSRNPQQETNESATSRICSDSTLTHAPTSCICSDSTWTHAPETNESATSCICSDSTLTHAHSFLLVI